MSLREHCKCLTEIALSYDSIVCDVRIWLHDLVVRAQGVVRVGRGAAQGGCVARKPGRDRLSDRRVKARIEIVLCVVNTAKAEAGLEIRELIGRRRRSGNTL